MADEGAEEITSDFQCFVCGAIFTTEQDRRQHLEKEASMRNEEDAEVAKRQTELSERHRQSYESA